VALVSVLRARERAEGARERDVKPPDGWREDAAPVTAGDGDSDGDGDDDGGAVTDAPRAATRRLPPPLRAVGVGAREECAEETRDASLPLARRSSLVRLSNPARRSLSALLSTPCVWRKWRAWSW